MKKFLIAAATLLLVSGCIFVKNFGNYWKEAGLDPAVVGKWKVVFDNAHRRPGSKNNEPGDIFQVQERDGAYEITASRDGKPLDNKVYYPVKTLKIGQHNFFILQTMEGVEAGGVIWKYVVSGNLLQTYSWDGQIGSLIKAIKKDAPPNRDKGMEALSVDLSDKREVEIMVQDYFTPEGKPLSKWRVDSKLEKVE